MLFAVWSRTSPLKSAVAVAILWFVAATTPCLRAQVTMEQPADEPSSTPVLRVSVHLVVLDAVVAQPRTSRPVGDLTTADFELQEDGKPQTIAYFAHDQVPLSIVLMLDLTETVRPARQRLGSAAQEILGHLTPQDEVAVAVFSSTAKVVQSFTTDRKRVADAIEQASGMTSKETTFLNESVYQVALETLKNSTSGNRRAAICLTDGTVDIPSESTRKSVGQSVAQGRIHTKDEANRALLEAGASFNALIERSALTYLVEATRHPTSADLKRYPPGNVKTYIRIDGRRRSLLQQTRSSQGPGCFA